MSIQAHPALSITASGGLTLLSPQLRNARGRYHLRTVLHVQQSAKCHQNDHGIATEFANPDHWYQSAP